MPLYPERYTGFHQQTVKLALSLMDDDFSEETVFSIGVYLFTKGLSCIDREEQKNTLSRILEEASLDNSNNMDTIRKLIDEMDINEAQETIESYRNENVSEYSPELVNWLDEVKVIIEQTNYKTFCFFISRILGLTASRQILIFNLLHRQIT